MIRSAAVRTYLDHNASAIPSVAASEAAAEWLRRGGNPSSVHGAGREARAAVEGARRSVAASLDVAPAELVFCSGATEALHLAIAGLATGRHVVASALEHPAVFGALRASGARVRQVRPDAGGRLAPADFVAALAPETALVVAMAAHNELGNLFPVHEIVAAVAPVPVLCDAVQAWGRVPLHPQDLGCTALALSGHKIGAPSGVGALWSKAGTQLRPWIEGGPQERGRRAGTENVAGIVGLGVAAAEIGTRLGQMERLGELRNQLQAALVGLGGVVHGSPEARLPNTLALRFPGLEGELLLQGLDLAGVCISSGSACSAGAIEPSPSLLACGLTEAEARGGLRVSLGPETQAADVEHLLSALPPLLERARCA